MSYEHHRRLARSSWIVVAVALLITLQTATPVWAWGRLGHRVTARFAEKYLNPKAEAVKTFLDEDAYHDANLPVVRQRLYQEVVRLAIVLDEAWPGD